MSRFYISVHREVSPGTRRFAHLRNLQPPSPARGRMTSGYQPFKVGERVSLGHLIHGPGVWTVDGGPLLDSPVSFEIVTARLHALHGLPGEVIGPEHLSSTAVRMMQGGRDVEKRAMPGKPVFFDIGTTPDGKACRVEVLI